MNKLHVAPYFFKEPMMVSGIESVSLRICWTIKRMNLLFCLLFIDICGEKTKCHLFKGDTEEPPNLSQLTSHKETDIYPL